MKGYHTKVNTLAGPKQKSEVSLVVNLFQSVLDGFIRGEIKRAEYEPVKVNWSMDDDGLNHHQSLKYFQSINLINSCFTSGII